MLRRTWAALVAVALVASGACARGGDDAAEPQVRNDEVPMKLTVVMKGDIDLAIRERTVQTRVVVLEGGQQLQPTFGVQPVDLIEEAGARVQPGLTLIPYEGDGRYTIEVGSRADALKGGEGKENALSSGVRVEYWAPGAEPYEYLRRAEPCTVEVHDDGMRGRLQCPDVTHEEPGEKHFSLDFRWEKA